MEPNKLLGNEQYDEMYTLKNFDINGCAALH